MTIRERWKRTSLPNQLLVVIGLMAALFTGLYALATVGQIYLIKQASRESSAQMERTIAEAKNIADSMRGSLEQNRKAMEASAAQSKAALDASIEASRRDQR